MATTAESDVSQLSFEAALARLEEIVRTLEKGEAPLDQSIELPSTVDGLPEAPERVEDAPPVDPDDPQSAALGVAT